MTDVCPHGVSLEIKVVRQNIDGAIHESWRYSECLKCTESMGVIVLMNMLSDPTPPKEISHGQDRTEAQA